MLVFKYYNFNLKVTELVNSTQTQTELQTKTQIFNLFFAMSYKKFFDSLIL